MAALFLNSKKNSKKEKEKPPIQKGNGEA